MFISKRYTAGEILWSVEAFDSERHPVIFPSDDVQGYMFKIRLHRKLVQFFHDADDDDEPFSHWDVPLETPFQDQISYYIPENDCLDIATYISTAFSGLNLKQTYLNRITPLFANFVATSPPGTPVVSVVDVVECAIEYMRYQAQSTDDDKYNGDEFKKILMAKFTTFVTELYTFVQYDACVPDENCVICCEEFEDGEDIARTSACFHYFHQACIDEWLRTKVNCPVCRCDL